jgi:hypothetical protein
MELVVAFINIDYRWELHLRYFLLTAIGILAAFTFVYVVTCYGPWAKLLRVSGIVLAGDSDQAVAKAKVFITVWNRGLLESSPTVFLILTDEHGKFSIEQSFPFLIRRMDIVACSPDDRVAGVYSSSAVFQSLEPSHRKGQQRYLSFPPGRGHFVLRVYEQPAELAAEPRNQYETFRSGWAAEPIHVPSHSTEADQ